MLGFAWFYFRLCVVKCCRWNRNSLKCSDYCWVDIYFTPLTTSNLKETSIKLKNSSDATKVQNIILSCSWNVNCFYFYSMQFIDTIFKQWKNGLSNQNLYLPFSTRSSSTINHNSSAVIFVNILVRCWCKCFSCNFQIYKS